MRCKWEPYGDKVRCIHEGCRVIRGREVIRRCDASDPDDLGMMPSELKPNLASIQLHGPTRTPTEIAYIIANHCSWCEKWRPEAPKKKCASCSCGSTDTIKHLHERRIKNCPRQELPAAWTEANLQRMMANGSED